MIPCTILHPVSRVSNSKCCPMVWLSRHLTGWNILSYRPPRYAVLWWPWHSSASMLILPGASFGAEQPVWRHRASRLERVLLSWDHHQPVSLTPEHLQPFPYVLQEWMAGLARGGGWPICLPSFRICNKILPRKWSVIPSELTVHGQIIIVVSTHSLRYLTTSCPFIKLTLLAEHMHIVQKNKSNYFREIPIHILINIQPENPAARSPISAIVTTSAVGVFV
jgi:hypothetical protein